MDGNMFGCKGCQEKISSLHVKMESLCFGYVVPEKKNNYSAVSEIDCANIYSK